ncbi:MAG: hypothetical protein U5K69_08695 [Balneolaceae bacterium]|nr:hypothetical protein [Balneolaceae bacterium]
MIIKRFILLLVGFVVATTMSGYSQSDQVSFIHGLGDNITVWNTMAGDLQSEFEFNRHSVGCNSQASITTTSSSVYLPNGSVAVGHNSLGGVLAREYLRQGSPGDIKGLINVSSIKVL